MNDSKELLLDLLIFFIIIVLLILTFRVNLLEKEIKGIKEKNIVCEVSK